VLAQSNSPQARQALLEIVRQNSDPMLQTRAVRMMGLAGDDRARKELVGLYQKSSNEELRKEILNDLSVETKATPDAQKKEVLSSVFLAGNSQVLVDVLKNQPNADVRVATIRSLGVMGEQSNALISVYQAANEEQVRQAVLDAFVVQENADALSDLLERESDPRRKTEILRRITLVQARRGK
jgi:HEAT repeat protein